MLAIYKREMRAYFTTWIGYIFLAISLAISGLVFSMSTVMSATSETGGYFSLMVFVMIIFLPILTMKSFSEERKLKTELLLITSPISSTGMVLGKYLSALTMYVIYLILTLFNLIPIFKYAVKDSFRDLGPNVAMIFGNYIAIFLVGACFIAIGIFVSSLTENQFASMVITMAILLVLLLVNMFNSFITSEALRYIFDWLSIFARYQNFSYGLFDVGALFYYISVAGAFIFLTVRVFHARRSN